MKYTMMKFPSFKSKAVTISYDDGVIYDKSKKRKAYKKGEITFGELRDWLLHQEVEAQEVLESLMVTKR